MLRILRRYNCIYVAGLAWVGCYLILFGFARLTGGLYICLGFYLYGPGPFCICVFFILTDCLFVFLFVFRTVILCVISAVIGGGGGGAGFPAGGGKKESRPLF